MSSSSSSHLHAKQGIAFAHPFPLSLRPPPWKFWDRRREEGRGIVHPALASSHCSLGNRRKRCISIKGPFGQRGRSDPNRSDFAKKKKPFPTLSFKGDRKVSRLKEVNWVIQLSVCSFFHCVLGRCQFLCLFRGTRPVVHFFLWALKNLLITFLLLEESRIGEFSFFWDSPNATPPHVS